MTNKKTTWKYYDGRTNIGRNFIQLHVDEVNRAIDKLTTAASLKVYLFLLARLNQWTPQKRPMGVPIGETAIIDACGISRSSTWRAISDLRKAGLLVVDKKGNSNFVYLVNPGAPDNIDLRTIKTCVKYETIDKQKIENEQKTESQIWESKNLQIDDQSTITQKTESHKWDYKQNTIQNTKSNLSPLPPRKQNPRNEKVLARSIERDEAKKGETIDFDFVLNKIFATPGNLEMARNEPHRFIHLITTKKQTLHGYTTILKEHGYYQTHRKRDLMIKLNDYLKLHKYTAKNTADTKKPEIAQIPQNQKSDIKINDLPNKLCDTTKTIWDQIQKELRHQLLNEYDAWFLDLKYLRTHISDREKIIIIECPNWEYAKYMLDYKQKIIETLQPHGVYNLIFVAPS